MNSHKFEPYRHSGKFGIHGPVIAVLLSAGLAFYLGAAYSYLVKVIPFIYLNLLLTAGYGFVFGYLTGMVLTLCKVRNNTITVLCGLIAGTCALYGAWNAHIRSFFEDAPPFLYPDQILAWMKVLYTEGSWSLRGGGNVTGIPLVIVWCVEAAGIIGLSISVPFKLISNTPYSEQSQCWLQDERTIETLAAFNDPAHLTAFREGDLAPLAEAKPRSPGNPVFARLTMKSAKTCEEFCTVSLANITITLDKEGKPSEKIVQLTPQLILPKFMLELVTRFEKFDTATPPPVAEAS